MMPHEFLTRVVPSGLIVIAERKENGGFRHFVCESMEQAVLQSKIIDRAGHECYFGLGSVREKRVFNEKQKKWEVRVGRNILALKSLFIDIDVDPNKPQRYASRMDAMQALRDFCKTTQFPAPLIVSSGGGFHCYWPFTKEIAAESWRPVAALFKASLLTYGLKIDPSRTADDSSVLRVVGTHNHKRHADVTVVRDAGPYTLRQMKDAVDALARAYPSKASPPNVPEYVSLLPDNLQRVFPAQDPPLFRPILLGCAQMQYLAKTGGEWEPTWYAGLQVVRHCEESLKAARFISKAYPGFDEAEMHKKLNQLQERSIGPATCQQFKTSNPRPCETCPHFGKITSPIQLGHQVKEAAPPKVELVTAQGDVEIVEIPNPPYPYARRATGGIVIRQEDEDGIPQMPIVVHDYDMYPTRRMHSERHEVESTVWRVKQPIIGWQDVHIEQKALADPKLLHGVLLSKGLYVPAHRVKNMVNYMVAYIQALQKQVAVEHSYARLGWRDDFTTFVLAEQGYHADGTVTVHQPSPDLRRELPGLHCMGTLDEWKKTIQFYNLPGYDAHRFLFYTAFGAPLFHMTGYSGAILNATGKPGVGKSTTLLAVNSVWGHPNNMMVNGTKSGTTPNALHTLLSIYNNLPFCLDEITRLDPRVLGDFCLSVSQGQGKRRNTRTGQLNPIIETWSTTVVTTANTDMYMQLAADRRDAEAESMRALQIPIILPGVHTKAQADHFSKVELPAHYGWAGPVFISYVVRNYRKVHELVEKVTRLVDERGRISSAERFWSAIVASNIAGAIIARKLGLIDGFPIEADCDWILDQIRFIRSRMGEQISSPRELLAEFLEAKVAETLVLSQSQNLAIEAKVEQAPRLALTIRHEKDTGFIYIMKSALRMWCAETGVHFTDMQEALEQEKILLNRNVQKVLGAGTDYSKGQVRCWLVSVRVLER